MRHFVRFLTTMLLLALFATTSDAQLGTPHYKFQDRSQLKQLLLQNRRKPHALYDLTMLAARRGWSGTVLRTGDELLEQNPNDPYAQALVAFCTYTSTYAREWNWPFDKTAGDLWKRQSDASLWQSRSLRLDDPAIQLMAAVSKANAPNAREFDEALVLFRQVLKQEPDWADAHYWYARAMERTALPKGRAHRKKVAVWALSHYRKAEKLDGGLHYFLLASISTTLSVLDRPRESLAAFDAYLRAFSKFEAYLNSEFPAYSGKEGNESYVAKKRERLLKRIKQS